MKRVNESEANEKEKTSCENQVEKVGVESALLWQAVVKFLMSWQ